MAGDDGIYCLTIEKKLIDSGTANIEAEDGKVALLTNTHTPDFTAHDFYADLTNEVPGTGNYTTGGKALTGTEVTNSGGITTFDASDLSWASATIANARLAAYYADAASDELWCMSMFAADASSSGGTFQITWHASGIFTIDLVP